MSSENIPSKAAIESLVRQADAATFESIPNKVKPQVLSLVSKLAVTQTVTQYSGPLPPAEELLKYEQVLPGSAERLIAMAEIQSAHRIKIETFVIERQQKQSSVGQYLGFSIASLFLIGAVYTVVCGFPIPGTIFGSLDLVSLVSVFVLGRHSQKKDLQNK